MSANNPIVIGKNPTTVKPQLPLGTGTVLTPKNVTPALPGLNAAIQGKLNNVNVPVETDASIDAQDWVQSLTNKEMQQILPILKKLGASKRELADYESAKNLLLSKYPTYLDSSDFNVSKLVKLFKDNLTGFGGSSGADDETKSNGVTQYVTKQAPELIAKDVDKFLLTSIGSKNINPEGRQRIMDEVQKMIDAGTTTTSKMDKKTGKTTVVQTPGYSEERLGEVVSRVAKEAEPLKYEQQQQASFFDFIQRAEQMRGGR